MEVTFNFFNGMHFCTRYNDLEGHTRSEMLTKIPEQSHFLNIYHIFSSTSMRKVCKTTTENANDPTNIQSTRCISQTRVPPNSRRKCIRYFCPPLIRRALVIAIFQHYALIRPYIPIEATVVFRRSFPIPWQQYFTGMQRTLHVFWHVSRHDTPPPRRTAPHGTAQGFGILSFIKSR